MERREEDISTYLCMIREKEMKAGRKKERKKETNRRHHHHTPREMLMMPCENSHKQASPHGGRDHSQG